MGAYIDTVHRVLSAETWLHWGKKKWPNCLHTTILSRYNTVSFEHYIAYNATITNMEIIVWIVFLSRILIYGYLFKMTNLLYFNA